MCCALTSVYSSVINSVEIQFGDMQGFDESHVLMISLTSNLPLIGAVSNDTGLYLICKNNGNLCASEC
jgi:hypothetical protein